MTVEELLHELARRGITVTPTAEGRLHYTSPTAAAFTPELRDAVLGAKPALLARLSGEPQAIVETPHPGRSGRRPPAGSLAAAGPSPIKSPRRPPRTASRPAPQNRRPPSSAAPAPQTTVSAAPAPAPSFSSVSPAPAPRTTVTGRPAPLAALGPPPVERGLGLRRLPRNAASVPEPSPAAAEPDTDQTPSLRQLLGWGALLGTVALVGLAAWAGRRVDGHAGQAETSPAPSPYGAWGIIDGSSPGSWPGY